jgi:hypothetical protein
MALTWGVLQFNDTSEELLVSVAERLTFERLDLVVGSFHGPEGIWVVRQTERMAQEARGHGGASSWFSLA